MTHAVEVYQMWVAMESRGRIEGELYDFECVREGLAGFAVRRGAV